MDQSMPMMQYGEGGQTVLRKGDPSCIVASTCAAPNRQRFRSGKRTTLPQRLDNSGDESEPVHEPEVVQLNLKSCLMGVRVMDDNEEQFFSRQSSMSSMISERYRPSESPTPLKWNSVLGKGIDPPKAKIDIPSSPVSIPPSGSRGHSGVRMTPPLDFSRYSQSNETMFRTNAGGSRVPSGVLYPCPNPGSRPNSCQLNAVHFTMDSNLFASDVGGTHEGNDFSERVFQKLVRRSRLRQCNSGVGNLSDNLTTRSDRCNTPENEPGNSPVSTLDCPQSPTFSERSFRSKSNKKSLRGRSDDANAIVASQAGPADPTTSRPKSQLPQYLMSINSALNGDASDDDDFDGPSEAAWMEPEDNSYLTDLPVVEGYTSSRRKNKPTHERWSSSSSSWSLSLVPKPLRTVSTMVNRRHHINATVPGSSAKKVFRRGKRAVMPISLTTSFDGGSIHSRAVTRGPQSELNSGRSWWPELGSGRKSIWVPSSGPLQMDIAAEPDLHEPDMELTNNMPHRQDQDAREKVGELDFPFDNPTTSSFVFQEAGEGQSSSDARESFDRPILHNTFVSVIKSADLELSGNYNDPEYVSSFDSEDSHTFSADGRARVVLHDQTPQWNYSRSFEYAIDVADGIGLSSRVMSGLSAGTLSGCLLEMGKSGRFSVDLQREQKLDKAHHPRTPDVKLKVFKSEKSLRRTILTPCLPFLQRSTKNVPRIKQSAGTSNRRMQPVNSFTARLGSLSENTSLVAPSQPNKFSLDESSNEVKVKSEMEGIDHGV